ncbi:MAG: hypothetical protein RL141_679 [Candidatus Parcubacteria bacterium]|jgi:hypothetical protein
MGSSLIRCVGFAIFVAGVMLYAQPLLAARGTHQAPKLLNLWFDWQITDQDVAELAKWDLVVMDMDQQARFPEKIRQLRTLNPNIKILAYVDSANIDSARFVEESWFPGYKLAQSIPEQWYVHKGGSRASIWPGAWMLNVTDRSPMDGSGRRWNDALPEFIEREVWSSGLWDGIFLDNALDNATWFAGKGLDITNDGRAEPDADVDRAWKDGWQKMARELRRRLGPNALIMGNGSAAHAGVTNGILFENFPRYGWVNGFRDYQTSLRLNQTPSIASINGNPNNVWDPNNWKLVRLTLGTALLGDGYYSFDFGDRDHGQAWWYDEYDASLGAPMGAPVRLQPPGGSDASDGVWWRDYERGAVIVNSTAKAATVELPGVYERLRGTQDATVNNGRAETSVTVAGQDGLLLYQRTGVSTIGMGTAFRNGDFVRVYRTDGSQPRNAFFAQQSGATGAATVLLQDVDRDGRTDTLTAARGEVRIAYGGGRSGVVRPFGTAYRGGITLAAGNMDRDTPWELAVANDTANVRVVELNGTVRAAWRPYPTFHGTVSLAVGDLNGDGLREVATGAGPGGGPHIRVFKTDGGVWGGSWFAFDARERGGVSVAMGDMDGDGRDELITGSGQGTAPRIRLFNGRAEQTQELVMSPDPSSVGVRVSVADVDGDGKLEMLASGIAPTP